MDQIVKILENHSLVRIHHPDFCQHYLDFSTFINSSITDLLAKKKSLEEFRESIKSAKGFSVRLRDFVAEVDGRLLKLLGSSGLTTSSWLPNVELPSALATKKVLTKNCVTMSMPEIRVENELPQTHLSLATKRPSRASLSSLESNCGSEDSRAFDNEDDGSNQPGLEVKSQKLMKLTADMEKMKLRCKHVLDVTDKFCTLTSASLSINDVDGSIVSDQKITIELSPNLVKATFESIGGHLAVFTKTYTSRHSTSGTSPKSPGEF